MMEKNIFRDTERTFFVLLIRLPKYLRWNHSGKAQRRNRVKNIHSEEQSQTRKFAKFKAPERMYRKYLQGSSMMMKTLQKQAQKKTS